MASPDSLKKQRGWCGCVFTVLLWTAFVMLFVGSLLVLVWGHEDFSEFPGKLEDLQHQVDAWKADGLKIDTTKEEFVVDVLLENNPDTPDKECPAKFELAKKELKVQETPLDVYPSALVKRESSLKEYKQTKFVLDIDTLPAEAFVEECRLHVFLYGLEKTLVVAEQTKPMRSTVALSFLDMQCDRECLCQSRVLSKDVCEQCIDSSECKRKCADFEGAGGEYDNDWRTCHGIDAKLRSICFPFKRQGLNLAIDESANEDAEFLKIADKFFEEKRRTCTIDLDNSEFGSKCVGSEQSCYQLNEEEQEGLSSITIYVRDVSDPWIFYSENLHSFDPPREIIRILVPIALVIIAVVGLIISCCTWPISHSDIFKELKQD